MRERSDKTIRAIFWGVGITILLGLSCIAGISIEREHQRILELQKEHVATIAVVNMDDGVTVDNEQVNYASQLISFPGENFTTAGLTDAKNGIENGNYAAYIIIPETFSASVVSIENDPRKVVLEYQYNPNLAETAQMQAMRDVNAFTETLNLNIAYMYVDAVLAEFHRIQDDSSAILANDNAELERLENVDAELLIEEADHVEETVVDNDIQPVELSPYTAQNDSLLDSMLLKYMEAVQQAQNDFAAIQETRNGVNASADEFFSVYSSVVYDTNEEQAGILSEGRTSLSEAVGIYNQNADTQREEVENLIAELNDENERIANEQLDEILAGINTDRAAIRKAIQDAAQEDLNGSLKNYQTDMGIWLEKIVREAYNMGYADARKSEPSVSDNNAAGTGLGTSYIEGLKRELNDKIGAITINWDNLDIRLPESGGNTEKPEDTDSGNAEEPEDTDGGDAEEPDDADSSAGTTVDAGGSGGSGLTLEYDISLPEDRSGTVDGILDLFRLEYDPDEVNNVIQTCFVDRLQDVHQGQMARLEEAEKILVQNMDDYEYKLENYDPMSYVRDADLGTYIEDIEDNARGMLDVVEQNNSEYRNYAAEVYDTTSEHTSQLIDSLNAANTQTTTNIESCIDELKLSRLEINSQNVDMLEEFTEVLPYTRVGSQENTEVYDYIVNPVVSRTTGEAVPVTDAADAGNEISIRKLLVIFLGIGIATCMAVILFTLRGRNKKPKGKKENTS